MIYTTAQAARKLGLSEQRIRQIARRLQLPNRNGRYMISDDDLRYIASRKGKKTHIGRGKTGMKIIVNGSVENIDIIDPRTGISWIADFLGNYGADMTTDDDGRAYMDREEFDWWSTVAEQYQAADNRFYELMQAADEDGRDALRAEQGAISCDLEDFPAALQRVCDEFEEDTKKQEVNVWNHGTEQQFQCEFCGADNRNSGCLGERYVTCAECGAHGELPENALDGGEHTVYINWRR